MSVFELDKLRDRWNKLIDERDTLKQRCITYEKEIVVLKKQIKLLKNK